MAWTIPRTWVAGEVITAANVNTHLRDNLLAISGAWVAFTTTWSGTLGNGSKISAYTRIGRTIHFRIVIQWGSSTTHAAANQTFTLPVAESTAMSAQAFPVGHASSYDASAATPGGYGFALIVSAQTVAVQGYLSGPGNYWTNLIPITFATADLLYITGTYEANTD